MLTYSESRNVRFMLMLSAVDSVIRLKSFSILKSKLFADVFDMCLHYLLGVSFR